MIRHLDYFAKARKQLRKLDAGQRAILLSWMDKNIDGCENPRTHGKGLTADHVGERRYRIGSYRVLCEIQDAKLVVPAVNVAHKSKVYEGSLPRRDKRDTLASTQNHRSSCPFFEGR